MAKKVKRVKKVTNSKKPSYGFLVSVIITMVLVIGFNFYMKMSGEDLPQLLPDDNVPTSSVSDDDVHQLISDSSGLSVYVFDVGQADSILIISGDDTMLVDAGNNSDGDLIVDYLSEELNISQLDYLVGTHPHEDHIGGLDDVIDAFDIGKVYMPATEVTTKTYKDVIKSLEGKNITEETPDIGYTFEFGDIGMFTVLSVEDDYTELNFTSIVLRLDYGESSFIFTGDAIVENEIEMLNSNLNFDLDADILKVGHHGSETSSSEEFLDAISPTYSIISCEKDNSYGHPHEITLTKLNKINSEIYRTDELGTIKIETNGLDGSDEYKFTFIKTNTNH